MFYDVLLNLLDVIYKCLQRLVFTLLGKSV